MWGGGHLPRNMEQDRQFRDFTHLTWRNREGTIGRGPLSSARDLRGSSQVPMSPVTMAKRLSSKVCGALCPVLRTVAPSVPSSCDYSSGQNENNKERGRVPTMLGT